MLIQVNAPIKLATGETIATGAVIRDRGWRPNFETKKVSGEIEVWRTEADFNARDTFDYGTFSYMVVATERITNYSYDIPQAYMDTMTAANNYAKLGEEHPRLLMQEYALVTGIAEIDFVILSIE